MGLVLVIGVASYLYFTQRPAAEDLLPSVLEAPVEIRPVVQMVTDCLSEAGKNGIVRIGAGGGYIDVKSTGVAINPVEPTESDAVPFAPGAELAVPYWWYLKSRNTCRGACEFSTLRPPLLREGGLNSVESQLDAYVAQTLDRCTGNFSLLQRQGFFIAPEGKPLVSTTIGATGVTYILDYPLIITREGQEFRHNKFGTRMDVPLTEMYGMASEITGLETRHKFLEMDIKQVIDTFTGIHDGALPPVAYATFDMDMGKRWIKSDVQRQVRSLITDYLPLLQVWGTANHAFLETPGDVGNKPWWDRLYNLNQLIELKEQHPGIDVRFSSPDWWREHFDLNCRGQVCGPDSVVNTYGFPFGFQKYNFAYDISVPVLVEIRSKGAFGGEGFLFQHLLEANVRDNEPMPFVYDNPWDEYTRNIVPSTAASLLCDPDQRTGPEMTFKVVDGLTGQPVDAAITFACGDEGCALGETTGGALTTAVPRCAGAGVQAITADRYTSEVGVNTHEDDAAGEITLISYPVMEFKTDVKRVPFNKQGKRWVLDPASSFKRHGDQFVITLTRAGSGTETPFSSAVEICGAPGANTLGTVRLVPGNYTVSVLALYHDRLVFPPQKTCIETYCYSVPEEPVVFGSEGATCDSGNAYLLGASDYRWEVTPEMLLRGNTVIFKGLVAAIDSVPENQRLIEDIEAVSAIQERSAAYTDYLLPEVVTR